jgi:threonine/homoserine/homoserine lactone efflux protein
MMYCGIVFCNNRSLSSTSPQLTPRQEQWVKGSFTQVCHPVSIVFFLAALYAM